MKYNGADVVAPEFQSLISIENSSVFYGTVDGENIPTILVRAAVKEQYGTNYVSAEILADTSALIKASGNKVEVETDMTVLETLNGKPQTGRPVKVSQNLTLADQAPDIVTATFNTQYGVQTFEFQRQKCK